AAQTPARTPPAPVPAESTTAAFRSPGAAARRGGTGSATRTPVSGGLGGAAELAPRAGVKLHLAQADGVGRHLDALVGSQELERLVERELAVGHQPHQLVGGGGAHVGQMLLLDGIHVEVLGP